METRKEKERKGEREREIIDAFYPETPTAGLGSLLCFLCVSLFPSFYLLPSIAHSSAVSFGLSHSLLCLRSHATLFIVSTCCFLPFTLPQSFSVSLSVSDITDTQTLRLFLFCFVPLQPLRVYFCYHPLPSPSNNSESTDQSLVNHLILKLQIHTKATAVYFIRLCVGPRGVVSMGIRKKKHVPDTTQNHSEMTYTQGQKQ